MTDDAQKVPPSPEVADHAAEQRRHRRNVRRFYATWIALGTVGAATIWWNALTSTPETRWVPAAVATIWIYYGTFAVTKTQVVTYEMGWHRGTWNAITTLVSGRELSLQAPHYADLVHGSRVPFKLFPRKAKAAPTQDSE